MPAGPRRPSGVGAPAALSERRALSERAASLEKQVALLAAEKEEDARSFRQRLEALRAGFDREREDLLERLKDLQAKAPPGRQPAAPAAKGAGRERELEAEVSRVRAYYTEKLRALERRSEAQLRAAKRGESPPPAPLSAAAADRYASAEDARRRLEAECQGLRERLAAAERAAAGGGGPPAAAEGAAEGGGGRKKLRALEEETMRLAAALGAANAELHALRAERAPAGRGGVGAEGAAEAPLRHLAESQRQHIEQLLAQEQLLRKRCEDALRQKAALEERVLALSVDPTVALCAGLQDKIARMEATLADREEDIRRVMLESRRAFQLELAQVETVHREELREKDLQILGFKKEISAVLAAVDSLSATGAAT